MMFFIHTRLSGQYTFKLSRVHLELYNRLPYVIGARLWNTLPMFNYQLSTDLI